jgi:DNA-binding transcriptional regulator YiaG
MARPYSKEFIDEVFSKNTHRIGVQLAQECVKANLPAKYVAQALNVSRITIHNWFRGAILRGKNEELALALISLIKKDTETGDLPVKSLKDAKTYLENMIGRPL